MRVGDTTAAALNRAYESKRRAWAREIGTPYEVDGGAAASRGHTLPEAASDEQRDFDEMWWPAD